MKQFKREITDTVKTNFAAVQLFVKQKI